MQNLNLDIISEIIKYINLKDQYRFSCISHKFFDCIYYLWKIIIRDEYLTVLPANYTHFKFLEWCQKARYISQNIVMLSSMGEFNFYKIKMNIGCLEKAIIMSGDPSDNKNDWLDTVWTYLIEFGFNQILENRVYVDKGKHFYSNLDIDFSYCEEIPPLVSDDPDHFDFWQIVETAPVKIDTIIKISYVERYFLQLLSVFQMMLCNHSVCLRVYQHLIKDIIKYSHQDDVSSQYLAERKEEILRLEASKLYQIQMILHNPQISSLISDVDKNQISAIKSQFENIGGSSVKIINI